jgi:hypothetical protein
VRPRSRLGQIAAILVSVAAAIFIVGAILVAGVVVGAEGSGEHHGHGGYSQGDGEHHRGGEEANGSGRDGSGQEDSGQARSNDGDGPGQG